MYFDEHTEGPYRIYAGALESRLGDGYTAAVVVNVVDAGSRSGREAFRDLSLACGHRWESPQEALRYALDKAREALAARLRPAMLSTERR